MPPYSPDCHHFLPEFLQRPLKRFPASALTTLLPVHVPYPHQCHLSLSEIEACYLPDPANSHLKPFSNSFPRHRTPSRGPEDPIYSYLVLLFSLAHHSLHRTGLPHLPRFFPVPELHTPSSISWVLPAPLYPKDLWFKCQPIIITFLPPYKLDSPIPFIMSQLENVPLYLLFCYRSYPLDYKFHKIRDMLVKVTDIFPKPNLMTAEHT